MPDLQSVEEQRKRLELEVVVRQIQHTTTSNKLPSVEEALKLFAAISGLSGTVLGILWVRFGKKKNVCFWEKTHFFSSPLKEEDNACVHVIVFFFWLTDGSKKGFFSRLVRRRSGGAGGFFFS